MQAKTKEIAIRLIMQIIAACSLIFLTLIMIFLFFEALPFFSLYSPGDFFIGLSWQPTAERPEFGILPMILSSFAVTLVAMLIAIPLGIMTALWMSEIAPIYLRRIIKPLIELLAALPSVVMGFFGMIAIAPFLQDFFAADSGLNLFNAALMLSVMSVPTICSIAEDALYAVPLSLREASLALGATRFETAIRVVIPAAFSGIATAAMLGISRSIGETMVVLMVAGGAGIIPLSIFDPIRPMPAVIAAEMAEAAFRGEHYHALFAIGLILFLFTLAFNILALHISEKNRQILA